MNDSSTSFSGDGISETQDTLSHTEEIGLQHKLYENLTTRISLDNNSIDSDVFGQERYGGQIDFSYVRPIPVGQVRANFGYSLRRTDLTSEGDLIAVVDELHAWAVGFFFELDNPSVDLDSVVVKRPDGIPLTEGFDYTLDVVGNRTRVNMLSDFNINNGDQARVDYLYTPPGDLVYDTAEFRAGVGLNLFDRLEISYAFFKVTQDVREGSVEESGLQDFTNHRVDAQYSMVLPFRLDSETSAFYDNRESTFSPSESYGFAERLRRPIGQKIDSEVSLSYATTTYPDTDDETDVLVAESSLTTRLVPRSQLILNALYRDIGGTIDDRTEYEFRLLFQTVFRLVTCKLEISYEDVREAAQNRDSLLVFFRISRQF